VASFLENFQKVFLTTLLGNVFKKRKMANSGHKKITGCTIPSHGTMKYFKQTLIQQFANFSKRKIIFESP
jgi:hypothetical protein